MSNVIHVQSGEELQSILDGHGDVVVDFSAPSWCRPCVALQPHFDKASEAVDHVQFVMVDIDELPDVSNEYGIMSVPTVLRFRGGEKEVVNGRTVIQLVNELKE